jgi:D-alanine-D-alanine ligase
MAHVLVLYNQPVLTPGHPEEESEVEILFALDSVCKGLEESGHQVSRLGVGGDPEDLLRQVRRFEADAVFNLFEGIPGQGESESCVAGLLEWVGLPFTGSPAKALTLARDKPHSKLILTGAGLPTAEFLTVADAEDPCLAQGPYVLRSPHTGRILRWPLMVKPADQDASVGIDHDSVITTPDQLRKRVETVLGRFGGNVIIEEYVAGRELTVGVVEIRWRGQARATRRSLPPSEFEFHVIGDGWPIVTYDAKWQTGAESRVEAPFREIADVSSGLAAELGELALRTFGLLGLRDYARIDFRLTPEGRPSILEANPNPDLSPRAGLPGVLAGVGLTYRELIAGVVEQALSRARRG